MHNKSSLLPAVLVSLLMAIYPGTQTAQAKTPAQPSSGQNSPTEAGYRVTPTPAWVKDPGQGKTDANRKMAPGAKARRDLLVDMQIQVTPKTQTTYMRVHQMAMDSSTLREVSEPTIGFNPAYQRLFIHNVSVVREGKRSDRLKDLRVEMLRREQQLEHQVLDGTRQALIMLKDVRVGDVVELAYSIEGVNPIFEGKFSELMHVGNEVAMDRLHLRIEAPLDRHLQIKGVPNEVAVERFEENGKQVIRVLRDSVPATQAESASPPWYKVFPAFHVSEFQSWAEVDQWAQRLFAIEAPTGEVARRIADWKARQLPPDVLLAEVTRFVQDDIRYFSVSLGESSHRPKPAAQTLADRMGDCKDKVLLLNTLLKGLGFDAKPALVSTYRNKGLVNYLPSHDQFDHVISAVQLDGQRYFLDATANNQGYTLQNRGYYSYGQALIVGEGSQGLQAVVRPSFAQDALNYRQDWDLSDPKKPAQLKLTLNAKGLAAERWRATIANVGLERIQETMAGSYVRVMPGLKPVGQPELKDSRENNELALTLGFEHPNVAQYQRGGLELDLNGMEFGDVLIVPPEARRVSPFMLDVPRQLDVKVHVQTLRPITATPPPAQQISDKHFLLTSRIDSQGRDLNWSTHYERRSEEVLPADLDNFRERVMRARQYTSQHVRLLLVERAMLDPIYAEVDRRVQPYYQPGTRPDALMRLMQDQELNRMLANRVLPLLNPQSPMASQVLTERAMANNQVGAFRDGLLDAQAALAGNPDSNDALEARGVALVGLNRLDEAGKDFERLQRQGARNAPGIWLGISQFVQGRYTDAESTFRNQVADSAGDERTYALIWLNLSVDRQRPGQGGSAVSQDLPNVDSQKWPGTLLHFLSGKLTRDALLRQAREDAEQSRLRMAEANFFIGQQLLNFGLKGEARQWFERTIETRALPYREVTLAQLELDKLRNRP